MEQSLLNLILQQGPLVVLLLYIIYAGAKKHWVWGYQLAKTEDRCEKLESLLFRQIGISEKAVEKLETTKATTERA